MKRSVQLPGVRKWAGEDLLELQSEGLAILDQFFGQYGDMVISGCDVDAEAGTITPGLVGLTGKDQDGNDTYKVCPFAGAAEIDVFPVYLALRYETITREYADSVVRPIAYQYSAELLRVLPEGRPSIALSSGSVIRFTDAIQDDAHRFVSLIEKTKIGNIDLLMAMLPTPIDHEPAKLDNAPRVGKLVYTTDEEGERTFWRCYDNTPGECVWQKSDGGGVEAVYEKVNVTVKSNQAQPDENVSDAGFVLTYGDVTKEYQWAGKAMTLQVPPGVEYQITPKEVEGYKTPLAVSFSSIMANARDVEFEYKTEKLTVLASTNNEESIVGQIILVTNIDTLAVLYNENLENNMSFFIPFDMNYQVEVSSKEGYKTPQVLTFFASRATRSTEFVYDKIYETILTFDMSISDPENITGYNQGVVVDILAQMRRCLAKYSDANEVTIAYLNNDNSNYYEDGTDAVLTGEEGEVMVLKPSFYYKINAISDTVFEVRISIANTDGSYIHSPKCLIAAYKASYHNGVLRTRSGVVPATTNSISAYASQAKNRGEGYNIIDPEINNMIALLFYAKYGTRDTRGTIGFGNYLMSNRVTGMLNSIGNKDTTPNENLPYSAFNGIEAASDWIAEGMNNASYNSSTKKITITHLDGSVRILTLPAPGGYIKEIHAKTGPHFDVFPLALGGSQTTYYGDYFDSDTGGAGVAGSSGGDRRGVASTLVSISTSHYHATRLIFRGNVVEAESTQVFKEIPLIN